MAGERVWEGRSTYLRRGRSAADAQGAAPAGGAGAPDVPGGPPAGLLRVPEDLGRRYAAVSGDVNPIHLHALTARTMGFPRAIAHGMWTAARTLAALGPRADGPSSSSVWFRKPVLLPSTVELVVDDSPHRVVAGLVSGRRPSGASTSSSSCTPDAGSPHRRRRSPGTVCWSARETVGPRRLTYRRRDASPPPNTRRSPGRHGSWTR